MLHLLSHWAERNITLHVHKINSNDATPPTTWSLKVKRVVCAEPFFFSKPWGSTASLLVDCCSSFVACVGIHLESEISKYLLHHFNNILQVRLIDRLVGWSWGLFIITVTFEPLNYTLSHSRKCVDDISTHIEERHHLDAIAAADSGYLTFCILPCLAAACGLRLLCCLHARWSLVVGCWADLLVSSHIDKAIHHLHGWNQLLLPSLLLKPASGSLVGMRDYFQGRTQEPTRYLEKSPNASKSGTRQTTSLYSMSASTPMTSASHCPHCIMIGVSISWISVHFRRQCCLRYPCSGCGKLHGKVWDIS